MDEKNYLSESLLKDKPHKRFSLVIKDGSITSSKIKDGSIVTEKIANNSITEDKLDPDSRDKLNKMLDAEDAIARANEAAKKATDATKAAKDATEETITATDSAITATANTIEATNDAKDAIKAANASAEKADKQATRAKDIADHPNTIKDGFWWEWDADKQEYVKTDHVSVEDIDFPSMYIDDEKKELHALMKKTSDTEEEKDVNLGKVAFNPRGTWDAGINYYIFDTVYHNKRYYYAKQDNINHAPTVESDYWGMMLDMAQATSDTVKDQIPVEGSSHFISKLVDDTAKGTITFYEIQKMLRGLSVGNFSNYAGGKWSLDSEGRSYLTTDYLYVRMKALFETLEILHTDTIGGKLVISPVGSNRILKVEEVTVTYENVVQQAYRCYFLAEQDGAEVQNRWKVGDLARSESFNVKKGIYHHISNHFLWRLVIGTNGEDPIEIEDDEHKFKKYNYVDLSQTDCAPLSDAPAPDDVLNQLGNKTDVSRQSALIFSAVDNYAPCVSLLQGVDSYSLAGKEYIEYGVNNGKAFFNVFGDTYIGDKNVNDPRSFIKFNSETKKLEIKANLSIDSTYDGKDLSDYIVDNTLSEEDVKNLVNGVKEDLQGQIDGAIETWFFEGEPTLDNEPAVNWKDDVTKNVHLGDLYYDKLTGMAYRFMLDENEYKWVLIKDLDITKALADAAKAQLTADGKMTVFSEQPEPPYQEGDIWVNATYEKIYKNDLLRCKISKEKGDAFDINDWQLASKYTDDTALDDFKQEYTEAMKSYKKQLDGKVETWYYNYPPSTTNEPASLWETDADKENHAGDLFFNTSTGFAYRWTGSKWSRIQDQGIIDALDAASNAQDTADHKRTNFTSQPIPPYDLGDLWTKDGENGKTLMVCIVAKAKDEEFSEDDWEESNDKGLNDFSDEVNKSLEGIQDQLDQKAETWYQEEDPSLKWSTDEDKALHKGDLWYQISTTKTFYYNGEKWVEQEIPRDVFDLFDGKSSIYVSQPKSYKERDLWILLEDTTLNGITYPKGEMLTAIRDSGEEGFKEEDWAKLVRYTDNTELDRFKEGYAVTVEDMQKQLDGKIETWFYDYIPNENNEPASLWKNDDPSLDTRQLHKGDLFYYTEKGYVYRWSGTKWVEIHDADIKEALDAAKDAQDTADRKRANFLTKPVPPYDEGDLWTETTGDGKILRVCITSKKEGEKFADEDWVESNDATLNSFSATVTESLKGIQGQIDQKAETWYQESDPSADWTDKDTKARHKSDLWYNTKTGKTYYYDGEDWQFQDVPREVFDRIDGKSSIYVTQPESYEARDLWILEKDYTLNGTKYSKGEILTAQNSGSSFLAEDWVKLVKYTDDSLAKEVQQNFKALNSTVETLDNNFNKFKEDGVFNIAEIKAMKADIKNIEIAYKQAEASYLELYSSSLLKDVDADHTYKTTLNTTYKDLGTKKDAYISVINAILNSYDGKDIAISEDDSKKITDAYNAFTEAYKAFYSALGKAEVIISVQLDSRLSEAIKKYDKELGDWSYLPTVLKKGTTDIDGGLLLTSLIGLRDTSLEDKPVSGGINGDTSKGASSIAAWFGGPMIDKDKLATTDAQGNTLSYTAGSDYARVVIRHDGSGYFASGGLWWETDGNLHADPNSFIINKTAVGVYFSEFIPLDKSGLVYAGNDISKVGSLHQSFPIQNLRVLNDVAIGNSDKQKNNLHHIYIGKIKITADGNTLSFTNSDDENDVVNIWTTGGISAYGASGGTGGGGGLNGNIISYATAINMTTSDESTEVASAWSIKKLSDRIKEVSSAIPSISVDVPTSGNAITGASYDEATGKLSFTKGTFLTSHQSLSAYLKSEDAAKVYAPVSHTHTKANITDMPTDLGDFTNTAGFTKNKGTVTSVKLTAPTGFTVTNGTVTTSGTIALGFATGYSLPSDATQEKWTSAYDWYKLMTTDEEEADGVINKWNEVVNFLANISQTDTLSGIVDGINTSITDEVTRAKKAEKANADNITANANSIKTLKGYFDANGNAKKALQLTNARKLWGNSFNGTSDINGNITMQSTDGTYIQIGGVRIVYDEKNTALKVVKSDGTTAANLYATGGVSAYGSSSISGSGGGLNGNVLSYESAKALTSNSDETTQIASAWSIKKLYDEISNLDLSGSAKTSISATTSGSGNAITSASYDSETGKFTFTKGSTFALSSHTHNYLSKLTVGTKEYTVTSNGITIPAYPTTLPASDVYSWAKAATKPTYTANEVGAAASSHTHSVKINGSTKTIAATGGTAVDLGTYLTSHQSLADYLKSADAAKTYLGISAKAADSDKLDGYHETTFFRGRGELGVAYADLNVYDKGAENYKNPDNGIYTVQRTGYSEALIAFTNYNNGSSSGLDLIFHYSRGGKLAIRRRIDSNRLSGDWESLITSVNIGSQSVASAAKLTTARTINGTSFNGTADITTAKWGTARNVGIVNSDGTGTAVTVSVDGSAAVNLKLPSTIKASLSGNADTATKLKTTRTLWGQSFNGSANVSGDMTGIGTNAAKLNIKSVSTSLDYIHLYVDGGGSNSRYLVLQNGYGNVGIGTVSPSEKLHVAGKINLNGIVLEYDSTNKALKVNGSLYATGGITAYGEGSASGSGGLNGSVYEYSKAILETSDSTTKIASAYSIAKLKSLIDSISVTGEISATTSGSGNALTAVSYNKGVFTFTKGSTFLTSHQTLDHLISKDTRGTNNTPTTFNAGIYPEFKINSTDGLSDGGTYHGILHWRSYGSGTDTSGGYPIQIAYTANGRLWTRIATSNTAWGNWNKIAQVIDITWSNLLSKPTTLSGFGISDGVNSVSVSGSGNAVTSASVSGHTLTLTKGSTFLEAVAWWNSGDSHNANDLHRGITFAYSTHSNTATTGTLVDFTCGTNSNYPFQLQSSYTSDNLYFRRRNGDNGTWGSWKRLARAEEIPSLSGYATQSWVQNTATAHNADMVDGVHNGSLTSKYFAQVVENGDCLKYSPGIRDVDGVISNAPNGETSNANYGIITFGIDSRRKWLAMEFSSGRLYTNTRYTFDSNATWDSPGWRSIAFLADIPKKLSSFTNDSGYITSSGSCNYASSAGSVAWGNVTSKPFNWSGQSGQPSWLWGSNNGSNYYVWNPSNFSVKYAASSGNSDTVDGYHASSIFKYLGWWSSGESHDANGMTEPGYVFAYGSHTNSATSGALCLFGPNPYVFQLQASYIANDIFFRSKNGDNGTWGSWSKIALFNRDCTFSSVLCTGGITAYSSSDLRLKSNLHKADSLKLIKSLGTVYEFDYTRTREHSFGLIAQNVQKSRLSDLVGKDDEGYLKLNYWSPKLISLALGGIVQVDDKVTKLKRKVKALEKEVKSLRDELNNKKEDKDNININA